MTRRGALPPPGTGGVRRRLASLAALAAALASAWAGSAAWSGPAWASGSLSVHGEAGWRVRLPAGQAAAPGEWRLRATASGAPLAALWGTLQLDTSYPGYVPFVVATWETPHGTLTAGDFELALAGSDLVKLDRQSRGLKAELASQQPWESGPRVSVTAWGSAVRSLPWQDVFQVPRYHEEPLPAGVVAVHPGADRVPLTQAHLVEGTLSVRRNGTALAPVLDFWVEADKGETVIALAEPLERGERLEASYRFVPATALALRGAKVGLQTPQASLAVYGLDAEPGSGSEEVAAYYGATGAARAGPFELEVEAFRPLPAAAGPAGDAWRWELGAALPALSVRRWYVHRGAAFPAFDDPQATPGQDEEGLHVAVRPAQGWEAAVRQETRERHEAVDADGFGEAWPVATTTRELRVGYAPSPGRFLSVYRTDESRVDTLLETPLEELSAVGAQAKVAVGSVEVASSVESGAFWRPAVGGGSSRRVEWSLQPVRAGELAWWLRRWEYREEPLAKYRAESAGGLEWRPGPWRLGARLSAYVQAEGPGLAATRWRWSASARHAPPLGWQAGASLDGEVPVGPPSGATALATLSAGYRGRGLTALVSVRAPVPWRPPGWASPAAPGAAGGPAAVSASLATPYGSVHQFDLQAAWRHETGTVMAGSYRYAPDGEARLSLRAELAGVGSGEEAVGINVEWMALSGWTLGVQWSLGSPGAPTTGEAGSPPGRGVPSETTVALGYRF